LTKPPPRRSNYDRKLSHPIALAKPKPSSSSGDLFQRNARRRDGGNEQAATDDGELDRELDELSRRLPAKAP
jgi:hypothetical protein